MHSRGSKVACGLPITRSVHVGIPWEGFLTSYFCGRPHSPQLTERGGGGTNIKDNHKCKPCHASSRWYDSAMKSQGKVPGDMKTRYPHKYKAHVLIFRVGAPTDPLPLQESSKVHSKEERRYHAAVLFEEWEAETAIEVRESVKHLTQNEFLGYMVTFQYQTEKSATVLWENAIRPGSTVKTKHNRHGALTVPVEMPTEVIKIDRKSHKKRLAKESREEDELEIEDFLTSSNRQLSDQMQPMEIESLGFGDPFTGGASVCPAAVIAKDAKRLKLTEGNLAGLDNASTVSGGSGPRGAVTEVGDEADEPGQHMSLVKARAAAKSRGKKAKQDFINKKSSPFVLLTVQVEKMGKNHSEVVAGSAEEMLRKHKAEMDSLSDAVVQIAEWGNEGYLEKYKHFMENVNKCSTSSTGLETILDGLKGSHRSAQKAIIDDNRTLALKIRQVLKVNPLAPQGFPGPLITWLGEVHLSIVVESADFTPISSSFGFLTDVKMEEIDIQKIMLWTGLEEMPVQKTIASVTEKAEKYNEVEALLQKHFDGDQKHLINMLRVPVAEADESTIAPWIPEGWQKLEPRQSMNAASPWCYGSKLFSVRDRIETQPMYYGLGGWWYNAKGTCLMMLHQIDQTMTAGSGVAGVRNMLNGLSPQDAKAWAQKHLTTIAMAEHDVVWVPAGYSVWIIGTSATTFTVHIPCMSQSTLDGLPKTLSSALRTYNDDFIKKNQAKAPWTKIAESIRRFLSC